MPCHSVRPGEDFAGQNLNFGGELSDGRLICSLVMGLIPVRASEKLFFPSRLCNINFILLYLLPHILRYYLKKNSHCITQCKYVNVFEPNYHRA